MSTVQLTDERLRTWLTDQSDCERMCISILAMQPDYRKVKPRRPMGGPDGSRDIEAVYKEKNTVWGAVGFRHRVSDSKDDKKWVKKKFKVDLASALKQNPELWGFVFFTNVDLTPSEIQSLRTFSHENNVRFTDIYHRERLRIALDSPTGLAFRFQYLEIPLSPEEQHAFFAHWGEQFDQFLREGFDAVDRKLQRLEFLHECSRPLKRLEFIVVLDRDYSPEELGHFRFLVQFQDLYETEPFPQLFLAGRDDYGVWHSGEDSQQTVDVRSLAWSESPHEELQHTTIGTAAFCTNQIGAFAAIRKLGYTPKIATESPFKTLGSLDGVAANIFMTKPLFKQVGRVVLIASDYVIIHEPIDKLYIRDEPNPVPWPETLSDKQHSVPWGVVVCRTGWNLDFASYTPFRV